MKSIARTALLLLVAMSLAVPSALAAGGIAVIELQKVVRQSEAGKAAMAKLNKKLQKLQAELKQKQQEIKAFKEDLDKKGPLLSADARAEKERQLQKMIRDYKEKSDDAQFEMKQAESKVMEPIFKVIENVVNEYGKKHGYSLILEKNMPGLYYFAPSVDITDQIIKAYNARSQAGKGAKK